MTVIGLFTSLRLAHLQIANEIDRILTNDSDFAKRNSVFFLYYIISLQFMSFFISSNF